MVLLALNLDLLTALVCNHQSIGNGDRDTHKRHGHQDPVAAVKVVVHEAEDCNDTTCVTDTDDPAGADTALLVTVQVHQSPADDDGAGAEGTHGDEADAEVLGGEVAGTVLGQHESQTDDDEQVSKENEWVAEVQAVGEVGCENAESESSGKGRHAVQLGLDGRVSHGLDDGRGKVGEGVDGNDDG